jgi:hypothetical protein
VVTLVLFAVTLFINYYASTGGISDLDVGEVSDKYELEITPASWTFSIWAFIYIWQALWIIYLIILTCKYEMDRIIFGPVFWLFYNLANIFNFIWIIVWVNEAVIAAAIFLIGIAVCLIVAAFKAHMYLLVDIAKTVQMPRDNYGGLDQDDQPDADVSTVPRWLRHSQCIKVALYALVLNGIPFYATWTVVASCLNFGILLAYEANVSESVASVAMQIVLTCIILFYWSLDFGPTTREYLKYTYSPYIVLIVAFCGILTNDYPNDSTTYYYTLALLIAAAVAYVAKILMGIILCIRPSESTLASEV